VPAPTFQRAIHLAPASASPALRRAGARHVVALDDRITHGPSAADPRAHARLRRAFVREVGAGRGAPDLGSTLSALPDDLGLVLWTSAAWRDVVAAVSAIDALRRARVPPARLRLAAASGPRPVADRSRRDLSLALSRASPLTPAQVRAAAGLWLAFTYRTPAAIERARRRRASAFPGFGAAAASHAALFPVVEAGDPDRLRLSALDAAVLGGLSRFWWRDAGEVVRAGGRRARALALAHGEALFRTRLLDWTATSPEPAVEFRVRTRGGAPDLRFRITPHGRAILANGLPSRSAPALAAGGQVAYRGRPLWVCEAAAEGWRLVPWRRR
jgi:hypothetical protein